ncbi:YqzE family protein [Compostibacillus humi]|uniref:YqzE family protein n=1 Tax=Compostibacillus humi TaxID=1245525 RepID=A0A8J2TM49_9BACI|nr:YqzE family protein [Compostibacillus humi]GFZ77625.1 YqzE family protein [Compostibacillus humi]HLT56993.1 YqzE family protein [Bacillota bacterium]
MSSNDYIKFMTQQIVSYLDTPKEERGRKKNSKTGQQVYGNSWFGILPFVLKMYRKK